MLVEKRFMPLKILESLPSLTPLLMWRFYKSLVAARRDRASGEDGVAVASDVYRVDGFVAAGRGDDDTAGGDSLFPGRSVQNFCYVVVDPRKRHATVWYHAYRPYW